MSDGTIKILAIEDNPGLTRQVRELLREDGLCPDFRQASSLAAGLAELERESADLVLLDGALADTKGLSGLDTLVDRYPELPIILFSGLSSGDLGFEAVSRGAQDYLSKEELTGPTLWRAVHYAIERQRLKSKLRQTTQDLVASETSLRQLIEDNTDGILIVDFHGRVQFLNPAAERIFQRSRGELLGQPSGFPLAAKGLTEFQILTPGGQEKICELHLVETRWQDQSAVLVALRDITARRRLEDQIRFTQKMESLGNLTRGVAHDFNNALAAIIGYASVLEIRAGDQPLLLAPLRQILATADRATTLTRALLSYSRNQPGKMHRLDLIETLTRLSQILPSLLGAKITLVQRLTPEPLWIMADSSQLEQALFNLATNARLSMPGGGTVTLEAERRKLTSDFRRLHGFGRPGDFARIRLSDTGSGMAPETCEKIFEPFFTTRETGEGTGLGLPITFGIIKSHRGYILCHSDPEVGTSFDIFLPLITDSEPAAEGPCPT